MVVFIARAVHVRYICIMYNRSSCGGWRAGWPHARFPRANRPLPPNQYDGKDTRTKYSKTDTNRNPTDSGAPSTLLSFSERPAERGLG